jgi:hypothetical protein
MEEGQVPVRGAVDFYLGLDVVAAMPVRGYLKGKILETNAIVMADRAFELLTIFHAVF